MRPPVRRALGSLVLGTFCVVAASPAAAQPGASPDPGAEERDRGLRSRGADLEARAAPDTPPPPGGTIVPPPADAAGGPVDTGFRVPGETDAGAATARRYPRLVDRGGGLWRDLGWKFLVTGIGNGVVAGSLYYQSTRNVAACEDAGGLECQATPQDEKLKDRALTLGASTAGLLVVSGLLFKFTDPRTTEYVYEASPVDQGSPTKRLLKELPWVGYAATIASITGGFVALDVAEDNEARLADTTTPRTREETDELVGKVRTARASASGLFVLSAVMGASAAVDTWTAVKRYRFVTGKLDLAPTEGGAMVSFSGRF